MMMIILEMNNWSSDIHISKPPNEFMAEPSFQPRDFLMVTREDQHSVLLCMNLWDVQAQPYGELCRSGVTHTCLTDGRISVVSFGRAHPHHQLHRTGMGWGGLLYSTTFFSHFYCTTGLWSVRIDHHRYHCTYKDILPGTSFNELIVFSTSTFVILITINLFSSSFHLCNAAASVWGLQWFPFPKLLLLF